jgi:hypothetical protein
MIQDSEIGIVPGYVLGGRSSVRGRNKIFLFVIKS